MKARYTLYLHSFLICVYAEAKKSFHGSQIECSVHGWSLNHVQKRCKDKLKLTFVIDHSVISKDACDLMQVI
jgi:hypothetical protein